MSSLALAVLGLLVVAVTPAVIVYIVMSGSVARARHARAAAWDRRDRELRSEVVRLEDENAVLRERNGMLVDLVGKRGALNGVHPDGWL